MTRGLLIKEWVSEVCSKPLAFRLFYRQYKRKMCVASVSGMVMLMSFAVFGLTESWTLRSPAISVFLLYFVTLATVIFQETDADKSMAL